MKKEAVLAELAADNNDIQEIMRKTNTRKKRVVEIIGNQVLKGKLTGMINEEETEYLPGVDSEDYKKNVRRGNIAQVVGIIAINIAIITIVGYGIVFLWLAKQNEAMIFYILPAIMLVITIITSILGRKTSVGKQAVILNVVAYGLIIAFFVIFGLFLLIVFIITWYT